MTQKWLITGASGLLGHNACQYLIKQGCDVIGLSFGHSIDVLGVKNIKIDLMDFKATQDIIRNEKPDVILHCAAITNVDSCEDNPETARDYHIDLSLVIATASNEIGSKLIQISTDQLWDGTQSFVCEETPVSPLNIYGQTKAKGEKAVLKNAPNSIVVRTNFFGHGRPWRQSFSDWLEMELSAGNQLNGFTDIFYTPIAIPDALIAIEQLVKQDFSGLIHVAGSERMSKYNFMTLYAEMAGYDSSLITPKTSDCGQLKAKRPKDMSLNVEKIERILGYKMPTISESINHILNNDIKKRKAS